MSNAKSPVTLEWETVHNEKDGDVNLPRLVRARVPGGWLVANEDLTGLVFVPDEKNRWRTPEDAAALWDKGQKKST